MEGSDVRYFVGFIYKHPRIPIQKMCKCVFNDFKRSSHSRGCLLDRFVMEPGEQSGHTALLGGAAVCTDLNLEGVKEKRCLAPKFTL